MFDDVFLQMAFILTAKKGDTKTTCVTKVSKKRNTFSLCKKILRTQSFILSHIISLIYSLAAYFCLVGFK